MLAAVSSDHYQILFFFFSVLPNPYKERHCKLLLANGITSYNYLIMSLKATPKHSKSSKKKNRRQ